MIETTRAAHARPSATSPPVPILIVDDDASKRLGLKAVLQPLGYSIVEADSGLAALRSLMSRDFAVIDTYGHQAGDVILQTVAEQLKAQARGGDALYRYGGEEFLCIFPEQSLASGTLAIQRMRIGLVRLAIPHTESPLGVLTISAGMAMLDPGRTRPASEVLKAADESLYRAKQRGRNRVEQPVPEPAGTEAR